MRARTAGESGRKAGAGFLNLVSTLPTKARLALRDAQEAREAESARKSGPTVEQRKDDLTRFYERYEDLVETVCDAAQYGPNSGLERKYQEQSRAYRVEFESVAPFVAAFLRPAPEDMDQHPFESFSNYESLDEFVASDDGTVISRITRTREALTLYGEHLRQLQAKHG